MLTLLVFYDFLFSIFHLGSEIWGLRLFDKAFVARRALGPCVVESTAAVEIRFEVTFALPELSPLRQSMIIALGFLAGWKR